MGLFNLYNKAKKNLNKSAFNQKNTISFQAYELLKKYVVDEIVPPEKLDSAHPKNVNLKILKNVSPRAMKTFYKLSDKNIKNQNGMLSQTNNPAFTYKKKLSPKAKKLLHKIKNDLPRYQSIDLIIKKIANKN